MVGKISWEKIWKNSAKEGAIDTTKWKETEKVIVEAYMPMDERRRNA